MEKKKRLTLGKEDESLVGGVCSGIAEYTDLDPAIIRIMFFTAILVGLPILIYVFLWIILPKHSSAV